MSNAREFTVDEVIARYGPRVRYLNPPANCWVWEGRVNNWGYGVASVNQQRVGVHRLFYELLVGPIPDGMVIDHKCRNPLCVNPAHLQAITHSENVALGGGWRRTHCEHGHSLEDAYLTAKGYRRCRVCGQARNTRDYARRQAAQKES